MRRALTLWESVLGPEHPTVATGLGNLADVLQELRRYREAEPLYRRALATQEKAFGVAHPSMRPVLEGYARLLRRTRRPADAALLEARAKSLGSNSN
jgi:Tetratricopeptide repeat